MKKVDLEKALRAAGCERLRHGGNHDVWWNPATGVRSPVPRHREIDERTAGGILKALGAKRAGDR